MTTRSFLLLGILALTCSLAFASDPSPLQDFCVAAPNSPVLVNGLVCKDPKLAQADDFFFMGLDKPGNTSNPLGSKVTPVNVVQIPGLNTLGISMARIDFAPYGLNPPHTHPRATEGLIHFQRNAGYGNAVAIAALSSQNPGVITIANAVFGSNPPISDDVLAKAFQVDKKVVDYLQSVF
ncbi:putative germin-like protein 2-1 [Tasmannia lanceolata]|uniref:putative germin-like protein 2-1 n=1 Tax=Tasmannia lanceolata TaxID=3420 RepID=UPI004062EC9D